MSNLVYVIITKVSPEGFESVHRDTFMITESAIELINIPEEHDGWEYKIHTYMNRNELMNSNFY